MDVNTNLAVFDLDADIITQHMQAYGSDPTRRSIYKTICFESDGDRVHIFSTNGRMLFHTSIPANGLPKFREAFIVDAKIPSRRFNRVVCEIGACLAIRDTQGHIYMFPKNDAVYPNCFAVEPVDVEPAKIYKPIDTDFLVPICKYVGKCAFWNPVDGLACDEYSARMWRTDDGDGVERKAVVMPYRRS